MDYNDGSMTQQLVGEKQIKDFLDLFDGDDERAKAALDSYGAGVINIECNMNHAFKSEPYNPHIHWHIYPRYKSPVEVGGVIFEDTLFGSHIDENLVNLVDDRVVEEIVSKLKS
jgi:diadenosine tetraphosphate (Ap4A) HIT family hydrolase